MILPDVRVVYNGLKQSAKKRNIPFDLSISDLYHLAYPITCPILGIPMAYNRGGAKDNSFSIDRIDSSLGYSMDNIQVISNKANRIKNNASKDELTKISNYYKEEYILDNAVNTS